MVKKNKKSLSKKNVKKKISTTKSKKKKSNYLSKKVLLENYSLNPEDSDYVNTWILYSLRSTLLDENVRNEVLKSSNWFGKFKKTGYDIILGPIYGEGISDSDLLKLLKQYIILGDNKIILFTLSNNPRISTDPDKRETHFQSFIMVNKIQKIFAFDPAQANSISGYGIYYPGAILQIENIVSRYLNGGLINFEVVKPHIDFACQIHKSDVFCQTWSLILQYEYMRILCENNLIYNDILINIPENIIDKYNYLNKFVKSIIKIKKVADKLREQYKVDIKSHKQPPIYNKIDPANELSLFKSNYYVHNDELEFQEKKQKQLQKLQKLLGTNTSPVITSRRV